MDKNLGAAPIPAVRLGSRLQFAVFFPPSSSRGGPAARSSRPPPGLMADVRIVIRRHFPVGGGRVVEKVAEDIALRRRPSRMLRRPERVERALAADVLPFVEHPFDRRAVVAVRREICACVAEACADQRLGNGGVQVLVLVDSFACPTLLRKHAVMRTNPCMGMQPVMAKEPRRPVGVVGDRRPKPVQEKAPVQDIKLEGWVPW